MPSNPSIVVFQKMVISGLSAQPINFAQSPFMGHRVCFSVPVDFMNQYFTWTRSSGEVKPTGRFTNDPNPSGFVPTFSQMMERCLNSPYTDVDGVATGLNYSSDALDTVDDVKRDHNIVNYTYDYTTLQTSPPTTPIQSTLTTHYSANDLVMAFVLNKCFGSSYFDSYDIIYNLEDAFGMIRTTELVESIRLSLQQEDDKAAGLIYPETAIEDQMPGDDKGKVDAMFSSLLYIDLQRFYKNNGVQISGLFESNPDISGTATGNWCFGIGDKIEIPVRLYFRAPVTVLSLVDNPRHPSSSTPEQVETVFIKGEEATFDPTNSTQLNSADISNVMDIRLQILCSAPVISNLTLATSEDTTDTISLHVVNKVNLIFYKGPHNPLQTAIGISVAGGTPPYTFSLTTGETYAQNTLEIGIDNPPAISIDSVGLFHFDPTDPLAVGGRWKVGVTITDTASISVSTNIYITVNSVGNGPPIPIGPARPSSLSVSSLTQISAIIRWVGGSRATSYTYTLNGGSPISLPNTVLSSKSTELTSLTANTSYTIIITAINSVGSRNSSSFTFTTLDNPPSEITNLTSSSITSSGFTISWNGGTGATSYNYLLNTIARIPSTNNGVSSSLAIFTNLQDNTSYEVVVIAVNSGGFISSSILTVNTLQNPPTKPYLLNFEYIEISGFIVVNWTGGNGATSYTYTIDGILASPYVDNGLTTKSVTFSGLAEKDSYTVVITALNSAGNISSNPFNVYRKYSLTNSGANEIFIVKYNSDGTPQWARNIGGTTYDHPMNMILDSSANVYVSGYYYSSTLTIYNEDGSSFADLTNSGDYDIYIVKYNSDGTPQWARTAGGASYDQPMNMILDASANVYLSGIYNSNPLTIYNEDGTSFADLTNSGYNDAFVVKYNSDGTPQWARTAGGAYYDQPVSMILDPSANVYLSGYYYSSTFTIYNADGTSFADLTNSGNIDTFIVKYNSNGTPQWARRVGGTNYDQSMYMILDASANVYVSAIYNSNPLTIYNADGSSFADLTNSGNYDIYIVKYNSDGTPQWARRVGGADYEHPMYMILDASANVYLSGYYYSPTLAIYNADGTSFAEITNSGNYDSFIVKYNLDGTPQWVRNISGTTYEQPIHFLLDTSANVYISGIYDSNPLTIYNADGTSFASLTNSGVYDIYIVKYNSGGTPQWARRVGGTDYDQPINMILDASANVYLSGYYYSPTFAIYNADGTSFAELTNSGNYNTFIVKYNSDGTPQWARNIGGNYDDMPVNIRFDIYANLYVSGYYNSNILTIYNADGTSFADLINTNNNNTDDTYIIKYNSDGIPQWAKNIGGNSTDQPIIMLLDPSSNIYINGTYNSDILSIYNYVPTFSDITYITVSSITSSEITISWLGGTGATSHTYTLDGLPITPSLDNGITTKSATFSGLVNDTTYIITVTAIKDSLSSTSDPLTVMTLSPPPLEITNIIINSITSSGFTVSWSGGDGATYYNYIIDGFFVTPYIDNGLTTKNANFIGLNEKDYYTLIITAVNSGGSTSSNPFNVYIRLYLTNSGITDTFVMKYNSNGTPQWARKLGGAYYEEPMNMILDSSANVYISGLYDSNPLTIYNADGTSFADLTNSGLIDIFIVKYNSNGTPQWARRVGGADYDQPINMILDSSANVYVSGIYASPILTIYNADGSSFAELANAGSIYSFIIKYNSDGTPQWVRRIGGNTNQNPVKNIILDTSANIYIYGLYDSNPLTIYNADGTSFADLSNSGNTGSYDLFILKYNSNGTPQWVRRIGGTSDDRPSNMILDASANVYVYGIYSSPLLTIYNADGTSFADLTNSGLADIFIVKYNSDGIPQWARTAGGVDYEQPPFIILDASANVYVSGYYNSNPFTIYNADGTSFADLTNSGLIDIFIVKYNSDGTPQWVRRIGGTSNDNNEYIICDASSNLYVGGYYNSNTITMYNADGTSFANITNSGNSSSYDMFILKYNSDGDPQWIRRIGGDLNEEYLNIVSDSSGNVYISGKYNSNPLIIYNDDESSFANLINSPFITTYNLFIVKYNSDGEPQWARNIGGNYDDTPVNIKFDVSANIYVCGIYYSNPLIIYNSDGSSFAQLTNSGTIESFESYHTFIVKYNSDGQPQWAKNIDGNVSDRPLNMLLDSSTNTYVIGVYDSNPLIINLY